MSSRSARNRTSTKAAPCAPSEHARRGLRPMPASSVLARASEMLLAAGYPSRVRILTLLLDREATVGEIAMALRVRDVVASQQLGVLRRASLVLGEKRGRHVFYRLADKHAIALAEAAHALAAASR